MTTAKLDGKKTYEYVFDYFSDQILSGKLKLHDKIPPEREIAQQLGVSRNSIREVMHMMEINGLIECLQGSGNYVRCAPQEFMIKSVNMVMALLKIHYTEVFHIRTGYEYTALKLAMEAAETEELQKMREILLKMDQPMSSKESAALDVQFHNVLVGASHNRLLILYNSMISELMDQFVSDFRARIMMNKSRADQLRRSHWGIYNALIHKDYPAGRAAMEKHFEVVGEQLAKFGKGQEKV